MRSAFASCFGLISPQSDFVQQDAGGQRLPLERQMRLSFDIRQNKSKCT